MHVMTMTEYYLGEACAGMLTSLRGCIRTKQRNPARGPFEAPSRPKRRKPQNKAALAALEAIKRQKARKGTAGVAGDHSDNQDLQDKHSTPEISSERHLSDDHAQHEESEQQSLGGTMSPSSSKSKEAAGSDERGTGCGTPQWHQRKRKAQLLLIGSEDQQLIGAEPSLPADENADLQPPPQPLLPPALLQQQPLHRAVASDGDPHVHQEASANGEEDHIRPQQRQHHQSGMQLLWSGHACPPDQQDMPASRPSSRPSRELDRLRIFSFDKYGPHHCSALNNTGVCR